MGIYLLVKLTCMIFFVFIPINNASLFSVSFFIPHSSLGL